MKRGKISIYRFQSPRCKQSHLHIQQLKNSQLGAILSSSQGTGVFGHKRGTSSPQGEGEPRNGHCTHSRRSDCFLAIKNKTKQKYLLSKQSNTFFKIKSDFLPSNPIYKMTLLHLST